MKKRVISFLLVICMAVSVLPMQIFAAEPDDTGAAVTSVKNPFTDVSTADWFYDSVMYAYENNLFKGVNETEFAPLDTMTRAMYVTVVGRIARIDPAEFTGNGGFSDVEAGTWYSAYVQWAYENSIVNGVGDGRFDPAGLVTREQMAAMTERFFSSQKFPLPDKTVDTKPNDIGAISAWAKESVQRLWECGLFAGDNNGNFTPLNNASRAEGATFLARIHQYLIKAFETCTVSFYDGKRLVDTISAERGKPLGAVPATEKTSKENAVFEGWYTDPALTTPFYADNVVVGNSSVYAKYTSYSASELTVTSFAQLDLAPDASFTVVKTGDVNSIAPVAEAVTLVTKDGTDPMPLQFVPVNDGYTVTANGGFLPGSSYELTLADGYCFKNAEGELLPDSVRTASFSIQKDIVENLTMSDAITYIQDTAAITYNVGGTRHEVLTPALVNELGGSFTYSGSGLKKGDILCFYKNISPVERDYTKDGYLDDPEVYVKVTGVSGGTVSFSALDQADSEKLYDVPDNFPVLGSLPNGESGRLTLEDDADGYALDMTAYAQIMGADATLATAREKTSVGDFVSIYYTEESVTSTDSVYFGKITAYDSKNGIITYEKTTADEIEAAMNLYIKPALTGDDLVSDEAKAKIETAVQAQVEKSGFAEQAATMLGTAVTETDSFKNILASENVRVTDTTGRVLSEAEKQSLNLSKSFEISDGVQLTVELVTSGDQLHFKDGGVQLGVGVDAQYEMETVDGGKVMIDLTATFVQELAIGVTANGSLVKKEILGFIPIPIGVKISSSVDIRSFTGVRFDVQAYTVAPEDESLLDQLKGYIKNPASIADHLPDSMGGLKEGLKTAGDVIDKIDEVKTKLDQVKAGTEQALAYAEDLKMLWDAAADIDGMPTEEEWKELGEKLGKTSISADLMEMLDLSTATELDADRYVESLDGLMKKYSEMLQRETDWVKLIEQEITHTDISLKAIVIRLQADFVVRADMNIAMGSSIQYQVGKRFTFWFKIGLFKPSAGSTTMDLVDEEFAFQFYIMGKLGIKMGVAATIAIGLGSVDAASAGITVEIGPYVKLYGLFIYEYERTRKANTDVWETSERMAGTLYVGFGLYLIVTFTAQVGDGFLEYSHDFVDKEYPLLEAGESKYPYAFRYAPQEDEQVRVTDADGDSTNGVTMVLPDEYRALKYLNLTSGSFGSCAQDYDRYNFTFSNRYFSMAEDGTISVNVPDGVRYITCDMTVTYKYGKLAFSQYDMQVTVPLVWTNLSDQELNEYYTASVRVGNDAEGYETVWSKRVRKNEEFSTPTDEELKTLVAYDDMKFSAFTYNDGGQTKKVIGDTAYDCTVAYKEYPITVNGIQNADGTTRSEIFKTHYGDTFDFSRLSDTGTDKPDADSTKASFTKFAGVTTTAVIQVGTDANGKPITQTVDLTQPVTGKTAELLVNGAMTGEASYVDDSVLVSYAFNGITVPDCTERVRKGTAPSFDFATVVAEQGKTVTGITPALGKVLRPTAYTVECGVLTGPSYTITFEENGGAEVSDLTQVGGSLLPNLKEASKTGYVFGGWYTDPALTSEFTGRLMPKENITLYAKLTPAQYQVTLHVNGGNAWKDGEGTKAVTFDNAYGTLPTPTKSGSGFVGWFTAANGGTEVKADTVVSEAKNHTLYAHWKTLVEIPHDFSFTAVSTTYQKGTEVTITPDQTPAPASGDPAMDGFVIRYMRQGDSDYITTAYPVNAGTYDAVITRPADNFYAPFEQVCTGVVTIKKATRTLSQPTVTVTSRHFSYLNMKVANGVIDDLHPNAKITFEAHQSAGTIVLAELDGAGSALNTTDPAKVSGLTPDTSYAVLVSVTGDPNYEDITATGFSTVGKTNGAPDGTWTTRTGYGTPDETGARLKISNKNQLSSLMMEVNNGESFEGWSFVLTEDLDMSDHKWTPIGTETTPFKGAFDGDGHTISGLYTTGSANAGLFGVIADNAEIWDLTVEDSYISGTSATGGITGRMVSDATVKAETATTTYAIPTILNCINRATVKGAGADESYGTGGIAGDAWASRIHGCVNEGRIIGEYQTGGIVGNLWSVSQITGYGIASQVTNYPNVANCINYGFVKGTNNHTGGIVGLNGLGLVLNAANLGDVTGVSCVGGVAGQNAENGNCKIINCYTAGTIKGTGNYVGAVMGRNCKDKGFVGGCYYLYQSATCNGSYRNATGTEKGSLSDGDKSTDTAYFTSPTSTLSRETSNGNDNLLTVLNHWVTSWNDGQCNAEWLAGADGYPLPIGSINTTPGSET